MSASFERVRRADDRGRRVGDAGPLEVGGAGRVAAHEVDVVAGRAALALVQHDHPAAELVALQLGDQLAGGGVPPADDDVVRVARSAHALALLQEEVDDEADDRGGERRDDRDPEEGQQPADDVAAGAVTYDESPEPMTVVTDQ